VGKFKWASWEGARADPSAFQFCKGEMRRCQNQLKRFSIFKKDISKFFSFFQPALGKPNAQSLKKLGLTKLMAFIQ
jgi:hypothetical protein